MTAGLESRPARDIRIAGDADALVREAAQVFVDVVGAAARARGCCRIALAGGATPRGLYRRLAGEADSRLRVPWEHLQVFWGDERQVAPDHADSNYRMARDGLLARVPLPAANIHRIPAELPDADRAARRYEAAIRRVFALGAGALPRFDLILLGLGADGHTASLFPGTTALAETQRLVVANRVSQLDAWRITLTLPVINCARTVMFLVSGADKAAALERVLGGTAEAAALPAAHVRPRGGQVIWMVDAAAASALA